MAAGADSRRVRAALEPDAPQAERSGARKVAPGLGCTSPAGCDKEGPTQTPNAPPQRQLVFEDMKSKGDAPMRSAR